MNALLQDVQKVITGRHLLMTVIGSDWPVWFDCKVVLYFACKNDHMYNILYNNSIISSLSHSVFNLLNHHFLSSLLPTVEEETVKHAGQQSRCHMQCNCAHLYRLQMVTVPISHKLHQSMMTCSYYFEVVMVGKDPICTNIHPQINEKLLLSVEFVFWQGCKQVIPWQVKSQVLNR